MISKTNKLREKSSKSIELSSMQIMNKLDSKNQLLSEKHVDRYEQIKPEQAFKQMKLAKDDSPCCKGHHHHHHHHKLEKTPKAKEFSDRTISIGENGYQRAPSMGSDFGKIPSLGSMIMSNRSIQSQIKFNNSNEDKQFDALEEVEFECSDGEECKEEEDLPRKASFQNLDDIMEESFGDAQKKIEEVAEEEEENDQVFDLPGQKAVTENDDDDEDLCYICYMNKPSCVFLDCGHGGVCIDCALQTIEQKRTCGLCRKEVTQMIEVEKEPDQKNLYRVKNAYLVSAGDIDALKAKLKKGLGNPNIRYIGAGEAEPTIIGGSDAAANN